MDGAELDNDVSNSRVARNINLINEAVQAVCDRLGRDASGVRLVAVSKTAQNEEIEQAVLFGHPDFAENRSDLFAQRSLLFPEVNWHFIGHIQTNKVKDFTGKAALVHSVATDRSLLAIEKRSISLGITQAVLVEVNTSGEATKDGLSTAELPALLELASSLQAVEVQGLMTIGPIADEDTVRDCFRKLCLARDAMQKSFSGVANLPLAELSMGMSDDYLIAVEEGATIIRIGRSVWQ
ncbi:MAG: YggS family pyridoxal phosphate-dependent enzyme [Coriobacteriia bacterium]|nr:YggS family pyridoxal phosphate-dependent enzyme [Coriobacteriia bacterium]